MGKASARPRLSHQERSQVNPYYQKLRVVIVAGLNAFEDGKLRLSEVWAFLLVLGQAIQTVLQEGSDFSDEDLINLKSAATQLYNEFVLPLDLPGPDHFIDPLITGGIMPGLVEGAFYLAKRAAGK